MRKNSEVSDTSIAKSSAYTIRWGKGALLALH